MCDKVKRRKGGLCDVQLSVDGSRDTLGSNSKQFIASGALEIHRVPSSPLKNLLYLLYTCSHACFIKPHVCGFMKQAWQHGVMTWCKAHLGFLRQVSDPITAFPQHITPFCPGVCYKKLYVVRCEEMAASKPQAQHLCNKPQTPNRRSGTKMQEIFPR